MPENDVTARAYWFAGGVALATTAYIAGLDTRYVAAAYGVTFAGFVALSLMAYGSEIGGGEPDGE